MSEAPKKDQKAGSLLFLFNSIKANKRTRNAFIIAAGLIAASALGYYFVSSNEGYYQETIAKITSVTEIKGGQSQDINGNDQELYEQQITAVLMNGSHKGEEIRLKNSASFSQVYDLKFKVNDEVFVSITEAAGRKIVSSDIIDFKRDKYIAYIALLFILLILFIAGSKGLRSLLSVIVNIVIFSVAIEMYLNKFNLLLVAPIAGIFFIMISIPLVSGINKKTASAMIGTAAGTLLSMAITLAVIQINHSVGIYYENMEFIIGLDYEQIFIIEVLIGTLGGIMDIAISISSAMEEICGKNPGIERKVLIQSGLEIGKDIMGTMANTLFFAYISGSIPMILLCLLNGYSVFTIINFNLNLEIIRALTGSIGIVISIPVTLYVSVLLLNRTRIGEA